MIRLLIEPSGLRLEVAPGETVLEAARRAGLTWRSVCGGHADCRTCYFTTREPPEAFSPAEEIEQIALATLSAVVARQGQARLACQARPLRDVVVTKTGVRGDHPPAS
ncbi:MAG: 2Fe-2S iron-sulfur cluster-binding protein [Caulobacterales bacterium]